MIKSTVVDTPLSEQFIFEDTSIFIYRNFSIISSWELHQQINETFQPIIQQATSVKLAAIWPWGWCRVVHAAKQKGSNCLLGKLTDTALWRCTAVFYICVILVDVMLALHVLMAMYQLCSRKLLRQPPFYGSCDAAFIPRHWPNVRLMLGQRRSRFSLSVCSSKRKFVRELNKKLRNWHCILIQIAHIEVYFTHLKLWIAVARHNFKWVTN